MPDEQPLARWTFPGRNAENRLRLYSGRVEVDEAYRNVTTSHSNPADVEETVSFIAHYTSTYSLKQVFESSELIASLPVEYELLKTMVTSIEKPDIDSRRWQFWRHFNNDIVSTTRLPAGRRTCLEITRWGTWLHANHRRRSTKGYNSQARRFDHCFFYGPVAYGLSLAQRTDLRLNLLEALGPDTDLSLEDAFPLFDYDRVPTKAWREQDGLAGAALKLEGDQVVVEGWDNPRDGGAAIYSIENFWTDPKKVVACFGLSEHLERHIPRAMRLLSPAVVG